MNEPDQNDELIGAYLDGELSADESERVERLLEENSRYRRTLEELRALRDNLKSLPHFGLASDFQEKVLRQAQEKMQDNSGGETLSAGAGQLTARTSSDATVSRPNANWHGVAWAAVTIAAALLIMLFGPSNLEDRNVATGPVERWEEAISDAETKQDDRLPAADARSHAVDAAEKLAESESSRAYYERTDVNQAVIPSNTEDAANLFFDADRDPASARLNVQPKQSAQQSLADGIDEPNRRFLLGAEASRNELAKQVNKKGTDDDTDGDDLTSSRLVASAVRQTNSNWVVRVTVATADNQDAVFGRWQGRDKFLYDPNRSLPGSQIPVPISTTSPSPLAFVCVEATLDQVQSVVDRLKTDRNQYPAVDVYQVADPARPSAERPGLKDRADQYQRGGTQLADGQSERATPGYTAESARRPSRDALRTQAAPAGGLKQPAAALDEVDEVAGLEKTNQTLPLAAPAGDRLGREGQPIPNLRKALRKTAEIPERPSTPTVATATDKPVIDDTKVTRARGGPSGQRTVLSTEALQLELRGVRREGSAASGRVGNAGIRPVEEDVAKDVERQSATKSFQFQYRRVQPSERLLRELTRAPVTTGQRANVTQRVRVLFVLDRQAPVPAVRAPAAAAVPADQEETAAAADRTDGR